MVIMIITIILTIITILITIILITILLLLLIIIIITIIITSKVLAGPLPCLMTAHQGGGTSASHHGRYLVRASESCAGRPRSARSEIGIRVRRSPPDVVPPRLCVRNAAAG